MMNGRHMSTKGQTISFTYFKVMTSIMPKFCGRMSIHGRRLGRPSIWGSGRSYILLRPKKCKIGSRRQLWRTMVMRKKLLQVREEVQLHLLLQELQRGSPLSTPKALTKAKVGIKVLGEGEEEGEAKASDR